MGAIFFFFSSFYSSFFCWPSFGMPGMGIGEGRKEEEEEGMEPKGLQVKKEAEMVEEEAKNKQDKLWEEEKRKKEEMEAKEMLAKMDSNGDGK
jgi:hypothetical protein